jgi:hypothetical protein
MWVSTETASFASVLAGEDVAGLGRQHLYFHSQPRASSSLSCYAQAVNTKDDAVVVVLGV